MAGTKYTADGGGGNITDGKTINKDSIKKIHLIFKTHLDLGFTDFAKNVEQKYFESYIPDAIKLSEEMSGSENRFIWTIGSYLIYEGLKSCDANEKKMIENAVKKGYLRWHALPFTTHTEMLDPSLFEFGIGISKKLDERFNLKTIAAKMTDVPGHTAALIPLLAKNGIKFLHIGVNPASAVPDVPDVFLWRDKSGNEIIVMYSKDDYGLTNAAPDCNFALSFAHTGDNQGPSSAEAVLKTYEKLKNDYPNAKIIASTLDDYACELLKFKDSLPVVIGEIGDTWIHGIGTDPKKVSEYRALSRLRNKWINDNEMDINSEAYYEFSKNLLCIPEHTWGMARYILNDYENYNQAALKKLRKTPICKKVEKSWQEQRDYNKNALNSITDSKLREEADKEIALLKPKIPSLKGFTQIGGGEIIKTKLFDLSFDNTTGSINYLKDKGSKKIVANKNNPIGLFTYEIFSKDNFDRFAKQYIKNLKTTYRWSMPSFTKPGMDENIEHMHTMPDKAEIYVRHEKNGVKIIVKLIMAEDMVENFGCPKNAFTEVYLPDNEPIIDLSFSWFNKKACRAPEALWFSFSPKVKKPKLWLMDKMGTMISPLDVIKGGNRHLHGVQKGIFYNDDDISIEIETKDAALVAPGEMSLTDFNNKQPALKKGFYFNLFNNQWNTNFPYWCEENAKFRFKIKIR